MHTTVSALTQTLSQNECKRLISYLTRIQYHGPLTKTIQVLNELHEAHVFHVPYDTLEILCGRFKPLVDLDEISCHADNKRGGVCFYQNSMFAWVLQLIGFIVRPIGARTIHGTTDMTKISPRSHYSLYVRLDENSEGYLCDTAFSSLRGPDFGTPIRPLPVKADGTVYRQYDHYFRIIYRDDVYGRLLQWHNGDDKWRDVYSFTLEPGLESDNRLYHMYVMQEGSIFQSVFVATMATPKGRKYLLNRNYVVFENGVKQRMTINTVEEMVDVLNTEFGNQFTVTDKDIQYLWTQVKPRSKL
jgi:N-hydroxyarylamine O-acetyltransferase